MPTVSRLTGRSQVGAGRRGHTGGWSTFISRGVPSTLLLPVPSSRLKASKRLSTLIIGAGERRTPQRVAPRRCSGSSREQTLWMSVLGSALVFVRWRLSCLWMLLCRFRPGERKQHDAMEERNVSRGIPRWEDQDLVIPLMISVLHWRTPDYVCAAT